MNELTFNEKGRHFLSLKFIKIQCLKVNCINIDQRVNLEGTKKRKKHLKKRTINKRKQIVTSLRDTDSEWETKSEQSITELSEDSQEHFPKKRYHDNPVYNLFEYPSSPEKMRDIMIEHDLLQESPILRSSRRSRSILKKKDNNEYSELLPSLDLPSEKAGHVSPGRIQKRISTNTLNENEEIFHKGSHVKTYPAPLKRKRSPEQRPSDFTFPIRFPTAASNLLWDNYVGEFHDDTSQYLASSGQKSDELTNSKQNLSNVLQKSEINPVPAGMERTRGYWHKALRKWISLSDQCDSKQEDKLEADKRETRSCNKYKRMGKERVEALQSVHSTQCLRKWASFRNQCNSKQEDKLEVDEHRITIRKKYRSKEDQN